MGVMAAAAIGAAAGLGVLLIVAGAARRVRPPAASSPGIAARIGRWWRSLSVRHRAWLAVALTGGLGVAVATGWPLAAVLLPAAAILVPRLLTSPPEREIEVLAGLDRWVRLVATSLSSGRSIRDAISSTRHQTPPVLSEPVARLCSRLDQRWSMREALFAMADELASADADAVLAALAIAAGRGGAGARVTLGALSDTIQDRLRALREISAERAKPRAVVTQVTVITLVVLGGALTLSPRFFAPYATPLGSVIAAALALAYLGCLAMLRRMTVPPMAPRLLRGQP